MAATSDEPGSRPLAPHPENASTAQASARKTVQAVGQAFQAVGALFVLGSCLVWVLSAWTFRAAKRPPSHWLEYLSGEHLPAAALTVGIFTTLVGGIGLGAVGMGLQGERPTSGRAAVVVTTVLAGLYWGLFFLLLLAPAGSWLFALVAAVLAVGSTILISLAAHSADLLRRFPPPTDQNVVREDDLEGTRLIDSPNQADRDHT